MNNSAKSIAALIVILVAVSYSAGFAQWADSGIPVCASTDNQEDVYLVSDGSLGAIIAWNDDRDYQDIYAQRVDNNGNIIWTLNGALMCGAIQPTLSGMIPDGAGGAILYWYDYRTMSTRDVYAQRVAADGTVYWAADGVKAGTDGLSGGKNPKGATDGDGGINIVWEDKRLSSLTDIYFNHIDALGEDAVEDGVPVCTADGIQQNAQIVHDGAGGALITWVDYRGTYPSNHSVFAQRADSSGTMRWAANGVAIVNQLTTDVYDPQIVSDGKHGAIIAWQDNRNFYNIYAQRIDAGGNVKWTANGIVVCDAAEWQGDVRMVPDGEGGAIMAWWDNRDGNGDIYAQRVDSLGNSLWAEDGVAVCVDTGGQEYMTLTSDEAGGCIVTWTDMRGVDYDIYAQRIDAGGNAMWAENGIVVCDYTSYQMYPNICPDGAHGAYIGWEDDRNGADTDIYVNSVNFSGNQKVATLLSSSSVSISSGIVTLSWSLTDEGREAGFEILRSESGNGGFLTIEEPVIESDGSSFRFVDETCEPGKSYVYMVEFSDTEGSGVLFVTDPVTIPASRAALSQNYPNPFNPSTTIRYYVPERGRVRLDIYDTGGRHVVSLLDRVEDAGPGSVSWNGLNGAGGSAASGVYFCRLQFGKERIERKMILMR